MLVTTGSRIRDLMKAGKTVDEIVAAAPNTDVDPNWAGIFITAERYTRMIYELVERELNPGQT